MNSKINTIKRELDDEILWRYKELKNISSLFKYHTKKEIVEIGRIRKERIHNTSESKYILRSAIPIIYAHWEGFFKESIIRLNDYLDTLEIDFNRLNTIMLSILSKDKQTVKYLSYELKFTKIVLDTNSNVDWKVLQKFLYRYNLNVKKFEKYSAKLNELVKIRNGISHGENAYHFDDISEINSYLQLVTRLMIITKNSVIDCLTFELYYVR